MPAASCRLLRLRSMPFRDSLRSVFFMAHDAPETARLPWGLHPKAKFSGSFRNGRVALEQTSVERTGTPSRRTEANKKGDHGKVLEGEQI